MKFDLNTREGQIDALTSYGIHSREEAEKFVDEGKFDEVLEFDHRLLVTDPFNAAKELEMKRYFAALSPMPFDLDEYNAWHAQLDEWRKLQKKAFWDFLEKENPKLKERLSKVMAD